MCSGSSTAASSCPSSIPSRGQLVTPLLSSLTAHPETFRSLSELVHIAKLNYQLYQQPVISGVCSQSDSKKLWSNIEPHLKTFLSTVHLREVASQQMITLDQEKNNLEEMSNSIQSLSSIGPSISNVNRITIELPFYSKFLLIAAFLASYNPAKSDKRFFVKHHGNVNIWEDFGQL